MKGFEYSLGDGTLANRPFGYWPADQLHAVQIRKSDHQVTPSDAEKAGNADVEVLKKRYAEVNHGNNLETDEYEERDPRLINRLDPAYTYTFGEWTQYIDVVTWSMVNVPGLPWSSGSLETFLGNCFDLAIFAEDKDDKSIRYDLIRLRFTQLVNEEQIEEEKGFQSADED